MTNPTKCVCAERRLRAQSTLSHQSLLCTRRVTKTQAFFILTAKTLIRSNEKIPVFRVTRPYLNLLVKHRIFPGFLKKKNIILCILKGKMPFKMHKIIFSSRKNN